MRDTTVEDRIPKRLRNKGKEAVIETDGNIEP
jgi:hypothetical protein